MLKDFAISVFTVAVGVIVGGGLINAGKELPVVGDLFKFCHEGFDS